MVQFALDILQCLLNNTHTDANSNTLALTHIMQYPLIHEQELASQNIIKSFPTLPQDPET